MGLSDSAGSQRFPVSADVAWEHLRKIASRLGKVKEQDRFLKRVVLSTGISAFSWGETVSVQVQAVGEDACDVVIGSGLKFGANIAGAHRNQKNVQKIISALSESLRRSPPSTPPSARE